MRSQDLQNLFDAADCSPQERAVRARFLAATVQEQRAYGDWTASGTADNWYAWLATADRLDAAVAELASTCDPRPGI